MEKPILLSDLDSFLWDLKRRCKNPVQLAATNTGPEASYMDATQLQFFELMRSAFRIVPVTARNTESFRTVQLPFDQPAILSFGGTILMPNGEPERNWFEVISQEARLEKSNLRDLCGSINDSCRRLNLEVEAHIINDWDVEHYVKVATNGAKVDAERLSALVDDFRASLPTGYVLHHNKTQIQVMPPFLRKDRAVRYYLDNIAGDRPFVMGGGDSTTDLDFIQLADFAIFPSQSQAFRLLSQTAE